MNTKQKSKYLFTYLYCGGKKIEKEREQLSSSLPIRFGTKLIILANIYKVSFLSL